MNIIKSTLAVLSAMTMTVGAVAQNNNTNMDNKAFTPVLPENILSVKNNPFGLVYDNAITANMPGHVNINPIEYELKGLKIRANVYTPAGYEPTKSYPAIVVDIPTGV